MTLSLAPLTPAHPDLPRVMALMARAFPENERLPAAFLFDPGTSWSSMRATPSAASSAC